MDPKASIDAILETSPHAFTIARWACLQRIHSPLIDKSSTDKDIVPTLYVMYASTDELKKNVQNLTAAAYAWADTLDIGLLPDMITGTTKTINEALYMVQEPASEKKTSPATE